MRQTKKNLWVIVPLLSILTSAAASGEERDQKLIGLSVYGGEQISESPLNPLWYRTENFSWLHYSLQPVYGWRVPAISNRMDFFLEGNLGMFRFYSKRDRRNSEINNYNFGISFMTSLDVLRIKSGSLFVEGGYGVGYWSNSPDPKLVEPNLLGLISYGVGVKVLLSDNLYMRMSWRFTHTSSIPGEDNGANTEGLQVGLVKYF